MENKKVRMIFEVIEDMDIMIDEESLYKEYGGDIHKVAKYLYEEEGIWWENCMKLIKTEIIN